MGQTRDLPGWRLLEFPHFQDPRGSLAIAAGGGPVPFQISRAYYIWGVPAGERRGGHAHRKLEEVIVAVAGSFDVIVDDGANRERVRLSSPERGLYIPTLVWHELGSFSPDAVALGLASLPYDDTDHFRDYDEFVRALG